MQEVSEECEELNIGFHLLAGEPTDVLSPAFLKQHHIGLVVTDFSPLRSVKYFHSDQGQVSALTEETPPSLQLLQECTGTRTSCHYLKVSGTE